MALGAVGFLGRSRLRRMHDCRG
ncbi:hypothetical protein [Singulisphaera sp. PoT]